MSVKVTLEFPDEVFNGLSAIIQRPEFKQWEVDPDTKESVQVPVFPTVESFVARRLVRDSLMNYGPLIPAVAAIQQGIADSQKQIEQLLTPATSAVTGTLTKEAT